MAREANEAVEETREEQGLRTPDGQREARKRESSAETDRAIRAPALLLSGSDSEPSDGDPATPERFDASPTRKRRKDPESLLSPPNEQHRIRTCTIGRLADDHNAGSRDHLYD